MHTYGVDLLLAVISIGFAMYIGRGVTTGPGSSALAAILPCNVPSLRTKAPRRAGGALARLPRAPQTRIHTYCACVPGRVSLIGGAGLEVGAGLVSLGTTAASRETGEALLFAGDSLYWCTVRMLFVTVFVILLCAGYRISIESFGRGGVGNELPRELD